MSARRRVYAYICSGCSHPMSEHRFASHATTTVEGPYVCRLCGCEVTQDSPTYSVTEDQYRARKARA